MLGFVARFGTRRWTIKAEEFFDQMWHDQPVDKAFCRKIESFGINCSPMSR